MKIMEKVKKVRKCSICDTQGHNSRTCPERSASAVSSEDLTTSSEDLTSSADEAKDLMASDMVAAEPEEKPKKISERLRIVRAEKTKDKKNRGRKKKLDAMQVVSYSEKSSIVQKLKKLKAELGISKSAIIREAVEDWLEANDTNA